MESLSAIVNQNLINYEKKIEFIMTTKNMVEKLNKIYLVGEDKTKLYFIEEILSNIHFFPLDYDDSEECLDKKLNIAQNKLVNEEIDCIIICDAKCVTGYEKRITKLSNKFLERVFEVPFDLFRKRSHEFTDFDIIRIFTPMLSGGRIGEIQFNLTNKCNLNCKLCSHFCPLVSNVFEYDVETFERDANRIAQLTKHVDTIGLWGGEALLNKDLEKIIYKCRDIFPTSRIELGTNGLLVNSIEAKLLKAIKKSNVKIVISGYPPTMKIWKEIKELLETFDIMYRLMPVNKFFKRYDRTGKNDCERSFNNCCSKVCHTVECGKFSSCYFPLAIPIYNSFFKKEVFEYEEAVYDLYDNNLSIESFSKLLKSPNSCCRYCGESIYEDWSNNGVDSINESDWCIS